MKKVIVLLVSIFVFLPSAAGAHCDACRGAFQIRHIDCLDMHAGDGALTITVCLTMSDGREYIVPVTVYDDLRARLEFASGTTIEARPGSIEIFSGDGYQQFDDIDNTTSFLVAYDSTECLIAAVLCLTTGFTGVGLLFCYWAYVACF
jgi:hypothetical protein